MKQASSLQRQQHKRRPSASAAVSFAEPTRLFAPVTSPFSPTLPLERQERPTHTTQFKHAFDRISIRPPVPDRDAGYELEPSGVQQVGRQAEPQEGEALQRATAPSQAPQNQTGLPESTQQEEAEEQAGSQGGEALQRVAAPSQVPQNQTDLSDTAQQEETGEQAESQEGEALQRVAAPNQAQENRTGLPDTLKAGVESLSGLSLDSVHVHYNSAKPAQVGALAYTQGTEIHVAPRQEQHLAHESWHVVQQMQGRVRPTLQTKGVAINDDQGLEKEADRMGMMANQQPVQRFAKRPAQVLSGSIVQRVLDHTNQPTVGFNGEQDAANNNRVLKAWMLTDGNLVGWAPAGDPPGYGYIRHLGLTNFWIRFHLVNEEAGGPGTLNNLVPASKRDNARYEARVESALKASVDHITAARGLGMVPAHDQVFFGVEVEYGTTAAGTQLQQDNAPYFPTRITYYHQTYNPNTDTWQWQVNGGTFDFVDPQPTDPGVHINLSTITVQLLRQKVYNTNWNADDADFLNSLAGPAGARNAEFQRLIDEASGLGAAESVVWALDTIRYGTTPFGERIDNEDAINALGAAIGEGRVVI